MFSIIIIIIIITVYKGCSLSKEGECGYKYCLVIARSSLQALHWVAALRMFSGLLVFSSASLIACICRQKKSNKQNKSTELREVNLILPSFLEFVQRFPI